MLMKEHDKHFVDDNQLIISTSQSISQSILPDVCLVVNFPRARFSLQFLLEESDLKRES